MFTSDRKVFENDSTIRRAVAVIICILLYASVIGFSVGYFLQLHQNYTFKNTLQAQFDSLHVSAPTNHLSEYQNIFFYEDKEGHSYTTLQEHINDIDSVIFNTSFDTLYLEKHHEDVLDYIRFRDKEIQVGIRLEFNSTIGADSMKMIRTLLKAYQAQLIVLQIKTELPEEQSIQLNQLIQQLQENHVQIVGSTNAQIALHSSSALQKLDGLIVSTTEFKHTLSKDSDSDFDFNAAQSVASLLNLYPALYFSIPNFSIAYTTWQGQRVWKSEIHSDDLASIAETRLLYPRYDPQRHVTLASYTDESGSSIELEIADHLTFQGLYSTLHNNSHLKGWAFENPGNEIDEIWKYTTQRDWQSTLNTSIRWNPRNIIDGVKGDFFNLVEDEKLGKASISFDTHGEINSAEYIQTPQRAKIRMNGFQDKKVALTFDDGPDPINTPLILDWLKEHHLYATFFVVGAQVKKYPLLTQRIISEGHLIGNHTTTHPNLISYDPHSIVEEYHTTQDLIQTATSTQARFARTPYSAFQSYQTSSSLKNLKAAQSLGLTIQELDVNTRDWEAENAEEIITPIQKSLEQHTASQILLHDTLQQSLIIPVLNKIKDIVAQSNYTIVRSDELLNATVEKQRLIANYTTYAEPIPLQLFDSIFNFFTGLVLFKTSLAVALWYRYILTQRKEKRKYSFKPAISILIPCFNEAEVLATTLASILQSNYKKYEVIIIDDGSTDETKRIGEQHQNKYKQIRLITIPNSGKAKALNTGIRNANHDIIICIDADTQILPSTLNNLVQPFRSKKVLAVAGRIQIGNNNNMFTRLQEIEYLISQVFDKMIQHCFQSILIIPGALSAFRKSALEKAGLYESDTLAEDADVTLRLHRQNGFIQYVPHAIAYTEAPETFRELFKQRIRWSYGNLQIAWKNRRLLTVTNNLIFRLFFFPAFIAQLLIAPFTIFSLLFVFIYIAIQLFDSALPLTTFSATYHWNLVFYTSFYSVLYVIMLIFASYITKKRWKLQDIFLLLLAPLYNLYILCIHTAACTKALTGIKTYWGNLRRKGNVKVVNVT